MDGDMKCPQWLFVGWCSSILAVTGCITADGYLCVSAYWDTITCDLNITGNAVEPPSATYSLQFTNLKSNWKKSCPLRWKNHSYSSDCKVTNGTKQFTFNSKYDINLCDKNECQSLVTSFQPSSNIQLTPPFDVKVQETSETFNVTWKSGYESHKFLRNHLHYDVLLQSFQSNENKTFSLSSSKNFVSILNLHYECCIKVRSKCQTYPNSSSKWSLPTCWKKEREGESLSVILTKSLTPLCVICGVLLFVFYSPATRMKIKTLSHTPSPAPFFQPLFQRYEGNLQEWLSPHNKHRLIYKTEEILKTDVVIVVPKSMTKEPEESQSFLNPSVTQLPFTQCPASYVGLPGMHEVSPPIAMVCPGDTSYTQLPCSVWGLDAGEAQVLSSQTKNLLEISCCDSGCSLESLTESPISSSPTSPADDSPPPFYCSDYCILNKTAGGVVPILLSKVSSSDVPSHHHHDET